MYAFVSLLMNPGLPLNCPSLSFSISLLVNSRHTSVGWHRGICTPRLQRTIDVPVAICPLKLHRASAGNYCNSAFSQASTLQDEDSQCVLYSTGCRIASSSTRCIRQTGGYLAKYGAMCWRRSPKEVAVSKHLEHGIRSSATRCSDLTQEPTPRWTRPLKDLHQSRFCGWDG